MTEAWYQMLLAQFTVISAKPDQLLLESEQERVKRLAIIQRIAGAVERMGKR